PVTFTGKDASNNSGTCGSTLTVVDTTPPVISSVSATPNLLWPPNHKMVHVAVGVVVADVCDPTASCHITGVTSNEPINGGGYGNTDPVWVVSGPLTVDLRAERSGHGTGRIYTVAVQCGDNSGNGATGQTTVLVPHDMR